jgi:environmental stress-induced protein Ves
VSFSLIDAESVAAQPWRNGGGRTRELLVWPATGDWQLRISRADVDAHGPFSAFPRVQRWFAVLRGNGVVLSFANTNHELKAGDAPLHFDGGDAPDCRLIAGPTQDLNLMLRHGAATMRRTHRDEIWNEPFVQRGLYTTVPGQWSNGVQTRAVSANTLLWAASESTGAWRFEPDGIEPPGTAWWLGFTPAGADRH